MTVVAQGLPLYQRIVIDLRDRVAGGELPPGAQVETELELMARYGVSRATVRQALGRLIADGSLEIRRGLGTYVRVRPVEHALGGFYTFTISSDSGFALANPPPLISTRSEILAAPLSSALFVSMPAGVPA